MRNGIISTVLAMLAGRTLSQVTEAKGDRYSPSDLASIYTAAHFAPARGFEHILARRDAKSFRQTFTTYFPPEQRHGRQERVRRLSQNGYMREVRRCEARHAARYGAGAAA